MADLPKGYLKFFKDLSKNNHKDWFQENKKRYTSDVREPMIALVEEVSQLMQKHDAEMKVIPAKCLSRINRDIRFSKDKTPYNIHMHAHISKGSKEDPKPGIAFRFGPEYCGIMGGFYNPQKERLLALRQTIASDLKTFQRLIKNKKFVDKFGTIQGDALKRIPKEFQEVYEKEPLIANKQFYYVKQLKPSFANEKNLAKTIVDYWLAAKPINEFLSK